MALIEIENLTKEYDGVTALQDVSLEVRQGEILGLIGPNGAGKTTLFHCISGMTAPTRGSIRLRGRFIHGLPAHRISQRGVARTFQIVRPFARLTLLENVLVALGHGRYPHLLSSGTLFRTPANLEAAAALLRRVGLTDGHERLAEILPLALKKRLEIARALALEPSVLLLDEPSGGLRYEESQQLLELIRQLNQEGMTIVLIEHNMQVVTGVCGRLVVLDHGVELAEGEPAAVLENPQVIEAYLGKSEV
jgi:branched-chain amino acid transport system ATP-binding protein